MLLGKSEGKKLLGTTIVLPDAFDIVLKDSVAPVFSLLKPEI